jgi:hypothetical protein
MRPTEPGQPIERGIDRILREWRAAERALEEQASAERRRELEADIARLRGEYARHVAASG